MQISALRRRLSSALLEFAWEEWAQMGVFATAGAPRQWAQDPEALLLLTFEVARDDPRLFDEVLDWLVRNESLVSSRRLTGLAEGDTDERLVEAVRMWLRRGPLQLPPETVIDPEEALFRSADLPSFRSDRAFGLFGFRRPAVEPSGKSQAPDLSVPINFAFRLRQLLGVGARAEVVRYLLTATIEPVTVAEVAASSGYTKRNVQEALTALGAAGVITRATERGEQRFTIDRSRWAFLLGLEARELPLYRDWPSLLGVLRTILRWLTRPDLDGLSEYMLTSQAADLLDGIAPQLSRAGISMSLDFVRTREDLEETIEQLLLWLEPSSAALGRPAAFEIVADPLDGYRWRLITSAGRVLALSATSYRSVAAAGAAMERVRRAPAQLAVRIVSDSGGHRWSIVADNGRPLAQSTEVFVARANAVRAARDVVGLIGGAA